MQTIGAPLPHVHHGATAWKASPVTCNEKGPPPAARHTAGTGRGMKDRPQVRIIPPREDLKTNCAPTGGASLPPASGPLNADPRAEQSRTRTDENTRRGTCQVPHAEPPKNAPAGGRRMLCVTFFESTVSARHCANSRRLHRKYETTSTLAPEEVINANRAQHIQS